MTQLVEKDGDLYLNDDDILIVRYEEGDCDTIHWPLRTAEDRENLRTALFDACECGEIKGRTVLLPDGEEFNIDSDR